jgi:hypothetical protein
MASICAAEVSPRYSRSLLCSVAEIAGIGACYFGEKAQRAFRVLNQILGALDAGLTGLRDRVVQDRHHAG